MPTLSRGRSRQLSRIALNKQAELQRQSSSSSVPPIHPIEHKHKSSSQSSLPHPPPPPPPPPPLPSSHPASPLSSPLPPPPPSLPLQVQEDESPSTSMDQSPELSPTRIIEDQLHTAYAHDDIHRAKILLLKLKGIEVTSDDDPRIDEVQDEDFDFCFLPNGGLVVEDVCKPEPEPEPTPEEIELAEKERKKVEKLLVCQQVWDEQQRVSKETKERARRRKAEDAARRAEEQERTRAAQAKEEDERRRQERWRKSAYHAGRSVVSYSALQPHPSTHSMSGDFMYPCMVPPASSSPSPPRFSTRRCPASQLESHPRISSAASSRSSSLTRVHVPFEEVVSSIYGPLFPLAADEELNPRSRRRHRRGASTAVTAEMLRQQHRDSELLDFLLAPPSTSSTLTPSAGKQVARPTLSRKLSAGLCSRCSASLSTASTSSPTTSSSSSSSSFSRVGSWFTFRSQRSSATSSSISTAITSPSTSPPTTSWLKSTPLSPILSPTCETSPFICPQLEPPAIEPPHHTCRQHHPAFRIPQPIALEDSPLQPIVWKRPLRPDSKGTSGVQPSAGTGSVVPQSTRVVRRLSQLVDLARSFQAAYMSAAVFSTGAGVSLNMDVGEASPMRTRLGLFNGSGPRGKRKMVLNGGGRAHPADVTLFLAREDDELEEEYCHDELCPEPPLFIPLESYGPTIVLPRTSIPHPYPHPRVFSPEPWLPPVHIPPHFRNTPWRSRMVGNPVYLRLLALGNQLDRGKMRWEGMMVEGSMNGGTEKLCTIKCNPLRRRSRLAWVSAEDVEGGYDPQMPVPVVETCRLDYQW